MTTHHFQPKPSWLDKQGTVFVMRLMQAQYLSTAPFFSMNEPTDQEISEKFQCSICHFYFLKEFDCGGDCTFCMAEAGDPDCIKSVCEDGRRNYRVPVRP